MLAPGLFFFQRVYDVPNTPGLLGQLRHFPMLPYGRFRVHGLLRDMKKPAVKKPRACIKLVIDVLPRLARPST